VLQEFAETAMNELLGWYGYGNNNHRDARACRSHSGSNSSGPESPKYNGNDHLQNCLNKQTAAPELIPNFAPKAQITRTQVRHRYCIEN
jgi:hypothetical protein